jgi:uncharacterized protein YbjT (DUF2867 family)
MRIAVVGATGSLGRRVASALDGHDVVRISRSGDVPVDLRDGSGLDAALDGANVVVDASDARVADGPRRLLDAGRRAGVRHHVAISIVGCERVRTKYYALKTEQERLVREAPVPWTVVRSTQFHNLVNWVFGTGARRGIVPAPGGVLQPVDVREVARLVAEVATGTPRREAIEIAGPRVERIRDLARQWKQARGSRALVVPIPVTPSVRRGLRDGRLTRPDAAHRGDVTFGEWLRRG